MNKPIFFLVFTLLFMLGTTTAGAGLTVRTDRGQLALDETLTLTITKEGRGSIDDATLQPLASDFQILSRSQSSSTQFINGSMSSSFTLTLELVPKRAGTLLIPAFVSGGDSSKPITIRVDSQPPPKTRADNASIFLETEVDAQTVSVQEQVIYTLRVYCAVEAQISEPAPPQLQDALLEKLGDSKFVKVIGGRTYRVFARKYAIFPQKSGVLEIPPLLVQAVLGGRQRQDPFSGLFANSGEEVRLRSKVEKITVREQAPEYPAGATWLPTSALSLAADWSRDLNTLQVGEPVNLTVGIAAPGLLGAQLPVITLPTFAGAKLYQDRAQVENLSKDSGIIGVRKESFALIPTRPGIIQIPELRIPWWDKSRHQVAYAVLPAKRLEVKGTPLAPPTAAGKANPPLDKPLSPTRNVTPDPAVDQVNFLPGWPFLPVVAVGLLMAGGWLVTLYYLIKARRLLAAQVGSPSMTPPALTLREKEAFTVLTEACRENDPGQARAALLVWLGRRFPGQELRTNYDLERLFPDSGLARQFAEINQVLYGPGPKTWHGEELLAVVEKIRKARMNQPGEEKGLPPLYR